MHNELIHTVDMRVLIGFLDDFVFEFKLLSLGENSVETSFPED